MERELSVLVVDDNEVFADALMQFLRRKQGVRIAGRASDGEAAVREAGRTRPDVILMDVHLPVLNGIEAAQRLRRLLHPAAIVMMTSHGAETLEAARRAAGADLAVSKSEILQRIDLVFAQVRQRVATATRGTTEPAEADESRTYSMEQLERLYRVRLAASLALGFAHDLNNPLTCVTIENEILGSRLQLLSAALESQQDRDTFAPLLKLLSECRSSAASVTASTTMMSGLIREFFELSQDPGSEGKTKALDLRAIAQDAIRLASARTRRRATVEFSVSGGTLSHQILGREGALMSAIVNLLINAADAFKNSDATANRIKICVTCDADRVLCEVSDNGPGIDSTVLAAFEPFTSSKPVGAGVGLGLATARRMLRSMSGDLSLVGTGPAGTTFRISLPVFRDDPGLVPSAAF